MEQVALKAGREVELWEHDAGSAQAMALCVQAPPLCHAEGGVGGCALET